MLQLQVPPKRMTQLTQKKLKTKKLIKKSVFVRSYGTIRAWFACSSDK